MIDPLLPLITNLSTKNNEYVFFVGAGFSKDAGVKSGWDILIETLKPIYIMENKIDTLSEEYYKEVESWYLNDKKYRKYGYSEILETLYEGEIERREYLKKYFSKAQPGDAHHELAKMVNNGLLRYIFTTNFDDLIEKALDEKDIDYDVIYSDDILEKTISWEKVKSCRIYKLHGDYKTGKVRNTISELSRLDPLISDDFQYIIDRHGLIVIGYAGRDNGVMTHFEKRKPYSYPIYWQYVNEPLNDEEYKYYYKLKKLYSEKHRRPIHFIKNNSASDFLRLINTGIEKLERIIVTSQTDAFNYKDYIIDKSDKKIRSLSINIINKYFKAYSDYSEKEKLSDKPIYKFDIFTEFTTEIKFLFYYVRDLLEFDQDSEIKYLIDRIFNFNLKNSNDGYEYVKGNSSYYIMMSFGSLFLMYNKPELIKQFFDYGHRVYTERYIQLIDEVSYGTEGWIHIGREKYKKRYFHARYTIIQENLLADIISKEWFDFFDAYMTLTFLIIFKRDKWIGGSPMHQDRFMEIFHKYFEDMVDTIEKVKELKNQIDYTYRHYRHEEKRGVIELLRYLYDKFKINEKPV